MARKNNVFSLTIDYKKPVQEAVKYMEDAFKNADISPSVDTKEFESLKNEVNSLKKLIQDIGNVGISTEEFEKFKTSVKNSTTYIRSKIAELSDNIDATVNVKLQNALNTLEQGVNASKLISKNIESKPTSKRQSRQVQTTDVSVPDTQLKKYKELETEINGLQSAYDKLLALQESYNQKLSKLDDTKILKEAENIGDEFNRLKSEESNLQEQLQKETNGSKKYQKIAQDLEKTKSKIDETITRFKILDEYINSDIAEDFVGAGDKVSKNQSKKKIADLAYNEKYKQITYIFDDAGSDALIDEQLENYEKKIKSKQKSLESIKKKYAKEIDSAKITSNISSDQSPADTAEINVEVAPVISKDFNQQVQNQVDTNSESIGISVSPKIDQNFQSELQSQIDKANVSVEVSVMPKTSQEYATKLEEVTNKVLDEQTETKQSNKPVDIEVVPKLSESFQTDLQQKINNSNITVDIPISPTLSDESLSKLEKIKKKISNNESGDKETSIKSEDIESEAKYFEDLASKIELVKAALSAKIDEIIREQQVVSDVIPKEIADFRELGTAIGSVSSAINEKTNAIKNEGTTSDKTIRSEVQLFKDLQNATKNVANGIKFPTLKTSNLDDLKKALTDLKTFMGNLGSNTKANPFVDQIKGLKISKTNLDNLEKLKDVLTTLKEEIDKLNVADVGSNNFLNQITSIVSHTQELSDLVKVINKINKSTGKINDPNLDSNYAQLKANLTTILDLKKKLGQTDDPVARKNIEDTIDSYAKQNKYLQEQIKLSSVIDEKQHNEIVNLGKKIGLQNQLNAAADAQRQKQSTQKNDSTDFTSNYKQLFDNLSKIVSLEKQLGRTSDPAQQSVISSSIQQYEQQNAVLKQNINTLLSRNSVLKQSTAVEQNKISILEDEISTQRQLNQASDAAKQQKAMNDAIDLQQNLAEVQTILAEDSVEWKRAMDILTDSSYFKEARNGAQSYLDVIGNIVSITRSIRQDDKTGKKYVSYQYKDVKGSSITTGANGDLLIEKQNAVNLQEAYKQLTTAVQLYKKESQDPSGNTSKYQKAFDALEKVAKKYEQTVGNSNFKIASASDIKAVMDLAQEASDATSEFKKLSAAQKLVSDTSIEKFLNKIYTFMGQNTKASKAFRVELESLIAETKALGHDVNLNDQMAKFVNIQNIAKRAGLTNDSFLDEFSKKANYTLTNFLAQYLSLQDVIRYMQNAVQTINDLDYALLDLSKTAKMSEAQLDEFYYSANQSAIKLGTTTKNIIDLASSWSRLGYGTNEEATKLSELTAKFAAISPGMSTSEASEGMISIMKAWQDRINAENMESEVLDKINTLGNKFALENNDVIEGMQKCSAALSTMGTSYTDAFALFTGAEEVMQDADKVGNGLKSVAMRIRGYAEDVESGEYVIDDSLKNISGKLIDLTKIAGKLPQGISVYTEETKGLPEAEKKYKSLVEYFREIHKYWDDFSETQQTQLLQTLFAKTQASVGASLIENWDAVEKALTEMENSAGSADAEMSKVEQTISYKINALKQTWVGFLQDMVNRNAVKGVIDALTSISNGFISFGAPGVIGGIAALTAAVIKLNEVTTESGEKIFSFGKIVRSFLGTDVLRTKYLDEYANSLKVLTAKGVEASINATKLNETERESIITKAGLSVASKTQLTETEALNAAQALQKITQADQTVTEETLTLAKLNEAVANKTVTQSEADLINKRYLAIDANKKEHASLLSLVKAYPLATAGIAGAIIAITTIIVGYQKQKQSVEDLASSMEELGKTYETNKKQTSDNISSVQSLYKEYQQLASGVDALGNNKGLSNENFDKYNDLTNQIAEKMPNLVQGWTDQGNAILVCKDNVELLNAEIAKQQKQVYQDVIDNGSDILKNYNNIVNGYQSAFYSTQGTKDKKRQLSDAQEQIAALKKLIAEQNSGGTNFNSYKYASKNSDLYKSGGYLIQPTKKMQEAAEVADEISNKWQTIISKLNSLGVDTSQFSISSESLQSWDDLSNIIVQVEKEIPGLSSDIKEEEDSVVSTVQTMADAYLHLYDDGEKTFYNLSNDMSASISTLIQSLDSDTIDALGLTTQDAVKDFVDNTVEVMLNNPAVGNAIVGLFTIDKSKSAKAAQDTAIPYINTLKKALADGNIPETLYNMLVGQTDWIDEAVEKQKNAIRGALGDHSDRAVEGYLQNQMDSLSTAEEQEDFTTYLNSLEHVINTIQEAQQAWKQYQQQIKTDTATTSSFDLTSFSSTIESLDKVNTAYQKVAKNIKANKIGKEIVSDINDIEALREEFKNLSDTDLDFGSFGSGMEGFNDIERVLTSSSSSAAEMQDAFDQLGTTLVNAKMAANGYDEASQQLVSSQLQQAGITKESADAYVASAVSLNNAKKAVTDSGIDLVNMTAKERDELIANAESCGYDANALLRLYLAKLQANGTTILTSDDIKNIEALGTAADINTAKLMAFQKAKNLASMLDDMGDASYKYGISKKDLEINAEKIYSEAMAEVNAAASQAAGSHVDFSYKPTGSSGGGGGNSSKDKKDSYIEKYKKQLEELGKLRDQDKMDTYEYLQYTRALYEKYFNTVNTPNEEWNSYIKLKKQYDELVAAKANLAKQDTKANKSSVNPELQKEQANIKELTAEYADLQKQLEEAKAARKASLADDWMGNVNLNDRPTVPGNTMAAAGWDGDSGSYSTILTNTKSFDNPINGFPWTVQFTPILPDGSVLDEQSCLDYVQGIIESATSKEDAMAKDKAGKGIFMGVFDTYQDQSGQTVQIDWDKNIDEAEQYYDQLAQLRHEDQADIYNTEGEIIVQQQQVQDAIAQATGEIQGNVQSVGETVKDTVDGTGASAESVEAQIQAVQTKLSEAEKNMSDDTREYLEQLREAEYNYLSGMKDLYDNVFSYLSGQIDKQISKLNEQKSAATENLKSQKESAVNALKAEKEAAVAAIETQIKAIKEQQKQIQKQIDAYQDEIDAINDANEARERELTLQKALYDLDKLQNQRTNLVYSESQGMHYEADLSGIRDARESVQDAKDDIAIANLQKKIDLLEKEKDALDEQIDALEEQKQAIEDYYDDLISQTEEYWDNLIAESEKYYDNLVKQLEGQKDLITEWQDALENAKFNAIIKDLTGKDAHEIFGDFENFDTSKLEELKGLLSDLATQYVSLETTMNADNTHVLDSFAEMNNLDLTKIPNYLDATSAGFDKLASCDFDVVKNGVEGIRTAFETLTNDKDAFATVGQHLSESFTSGFKDAVENEDVSPICGKYGDALTQGFNTYFADSEHTSEVGRYVTEGISKGMTSDDAKAAIDKASSEIADYTVEKSRQDMQINSPSELLASEVGLYAGLGVPKGIVDSLGNPEFQSYLQQFVDGVAQKLHDAFSQLDTSNLLDLSSIFSAVEGTGEKGNSTTNIFSQLLEDIQDFADAFANIDITNVVTQFTDLRDAVLDVSSAIGGTTGASESGDLSQGGTSGTGKPSKKSSSSHNSSSNQQSNSGGSLTEAMQTFGDTATEVLGGGGEDGEDEEGSGVIGQFATLKTKVEDVTAAIGTSDDSGDGGGSGGKKGKGKGKGDGESSGTLIEALQAEQEVAFDEEKGLPAQNEQWATLQSNIQKCVDAVQRLIDKLSDLEEFSLTVHFSGHSSGGGSGHASADGTVASHASGSFPVTMHSCAKGSNVGLEHDQRALIGEVGYEGLVRQNRFSLIGKNGAEMMSLKKGDIIFSHSQTKELLKNGKIHSRGKAVGTHSYADGTPLKSALKFAGSDYSSTQLAALATKLTGVMDGISVGIDSIERRTTELANKVPNVTTNTANKTSNVTIGDIHVSGVQDVDSFAKAVKSYLPGRMFQELHKN